MMVTEIIKEARKEKGFSLKDLADKTGVNREKIRQIENGNVIPNYSEIYETIFNALGLKYKEYKEMVFLYVIEKNIEKTKINFWGKNE